MTASTSLRERLDYLVRTTGREEAEIVADAITRGIEDLYRVGLGDAYLAGDVAREDAVAELGEEAVADLDYAREAVLADIAWGLRRE